jgi:16S rRNA (cytidine1402-2'-O)-methyltransferase
MVPAVPDSSRRPGALVVCPTPIGNLSDVTLRLLEELRSADVVACEDTRRTRILLDRHGIAVPLLAVHEHNEAVRAPEVVERIRRGERVALATDAGMPAVSDPGARIVAAVAAAGLEVTVLPGPSAVTAAVAASGLGGAGFVFAGFLPRPASRAAAEVRRLDASGLPVVAFESPRRLPATLAALAAAEPDRAAAVCRELSKVHEQVQRGTLADLAERFATAPKGEVTLVLAGVPARAGGEQDVPADALAELVAAFGSRRAAALASRLTGVPRNRLYQTATKP